MNIKRIIKKTSPIKSKGSALISALLMMIIFSSIAIALLLREPILIRKTELLLEKEKMHLLNSEVLIWAYAVLKNKTANLSAIQSFPEKKKEGTLISGSLEDLQSRFNLNNVRNPLYVPIFTRLLMNKNPELSSEEANRVTEALVAFVSNDEKSNAMSAEFYETASPKYRAAQQNLSSVSEFRLVRGVSKKLYQNMASSITALPEITPINVNTASESMLSLLSENMNLADIMAYRRSQRNFLSVTDFLGISKIQNIPSDLLTTESSYFMLMTQLKDQKSIRRSYSLLKVIRHNNKTQVFVVWESYETI